MTYFLWIWHVWMFEPTNYIEKNFPSHFIGLRWPNKMSWVQMYWGNRTLRKKKKQSNKHHAQKASTAVQIWSLLPSFYRIIHLLPIWQAQHHSQDYTNKSNMERNLFHWTRLPVPGSYQAARQPLSPARCPHPCRDRDTGTYAQLIYFQL